MTVHRGDPSRQTWGVLHWLAGADIGNAHGLTLGRVTIDEGAGNPRHVHDNCEEVLYLLTGRLRHSIGDESIELTAGDVLVVGPGVVHHAENIGEGPADMIVAYSSGERGFRLADE